MAVITNIYTNLSSVNCNPISFSVLGKQFATVETPVIFNNGLRINTHECLKNCADYSVNNKTSLFLTGLTNASEILTDAEEPKDVGNLTEIDSPLAINTLSIYSPLVASSHFHSPLADEKLQVVKIEQVGSYYQWVSSDVSEFNEDDVYRFIIQPDNTVIIESLKTKYLLTTFTEGFDNAALLFTPRIYPPLSAESVYVDQQKFNYALGPNTISLYQINKIVPTYTNVVLRLNTGVYGVSSLAYLTSSSQLPAEASLNFISYEEKPSLNFDIKDSFLVKYLVNPLDSNKTLNINTTVANEEYSQNYLGIIPFEYPTQTNSGVTYPLAIHGLKNYQTPEYKYSYGSEYVQGQKGVRRIYENIYSGTNQDKGLDNVYLGFKSDTLEINFKPDTDTPFYFSPTSDRLALKDSGLIEDGAIAGEVPFSSDRIYIKQQDYSEKIPDSAQPASIKRYSNTWLCSWLSGSIDGEKAWMDRYYNSAYYSIDEALKYKTIKYNDRTYPDQDYTFDVPSEMYLEPGALYRYFHTGIKNRTNFVNHLSSNSILQVTDWTSSPLVDTSPSKGEGILYFNKPENLNVSYINLDGSNHVLFPATTDLLSQSKLTVSLFLNVNDWRNVNGGQIFGNYYNSGFGLMNESSLTTPIITLVDNVSGKVYSINYRFGVLDPKDGFTLPINGGSKIIQRLTDYSYWIFDTLLVAGVKYDVNNKKQLETNKSTIPELQQLREISQVEIDSEENLYLYCNKEKVCVKINKDGDTALLTQTFDKQTNRIEIGTDNSLNSCFGHQSAIDNTNTIWEIVGGNLYSGKSYEKKKIFANIGYVQGMVIDADNYLWILNGQDNLTKIDTSNRKVLFTRRIGKKSSLPPDPCFDYTKQTRFMDFVRVPKDSNSDPCNLNSSPTEDRPVIVDLNDNQIYILNANGDILSKLSLVGLTNNQNPNMLAFGGFTGYQFLRKFTNVVKKISWKIKIANPNGKNGKVLQLPYDITNIGSGWHHFALSFDSVNGTAKAYLDSIQVGDTVTFDPQIYQLYYDYRTSLLLGCETIKNTTLNDIIGIDDGYKFVGQVAELRLYNKSLTKGEIEQLYFSSKLTADDRSLLWNMKVGDRSYIEQIKHWFKLQMPGSKSKYYNINIHNLDVPDNVKAVIESGIRNNLTKIAPANASLYKINWI